MNKITAKNCPLPGPECSYSFYDLYFAAFQAPPDASRLEKLSQLTQEEINSEVVTWAKKAGWQTRNRKGSDGKIYTAFAPNFGRQ